MVNICAKFEVPELQPFPRYLSDLILHIFRQYPSWSICIPNFLLGVTAKALRANIDWKSAFLKGVGQFWLNFHVEADVPNYPRTIFAWIDRPVNALQLCR